MWFIFVTARLLIFLSFQPRLAATLLRSCSVVNNLTRRVGLSPTFLPTSLAQPLIGFDLALFGFLPLLEGRGEDFPQASLSRQREARAEA